MEYSVKGIIEVQVNSILCSPSSTRALMFLPVEMSMPGLALAKKNYQVFIDLYNPKEYTENGTLHS